MCENEKYLCYYSNVHRDDRKKFTDYFHQKNYVNIK